MKICFVLIGKNLPQALIHNFVMLQDQSLVVMKNTAPITSVILTLEDQYGEKLDKF